MNGTDIFIDTNICVYLLNGDTVLAELLQGQNLCLSIITEMELYAYHGNNPLSISILDAFLQSVSIINIEEKVKLNTIKIRKKTKLKLPDSIIAASAITYNLPLITADKDFKRVDHLYLILYQNT
jgi:predicted nucleic acid-binding protein